MKERLDGLAADADLTTTVHRIIVDVLGRGRDAAVVEVRDGAVRDAHVPAGAGEVVALTGDGAVLLDRTECRERPALDGGLLLSCPAVPNAGAILLPALPCRPVEVSWIVASAGLGIAARRQLDLAVARARERSQFGQPIAGFQAVRHRLADAATDVAAIEWAVTEVVDGFDAGTIRPGEAAALKLLANEAALSVRAAAHQVMGGFGYLEEAGLGPLTRAVHVLVAGIGPASTLRGSLAGALQSAAPNA